MLPRATHPNGSQRRTQTDQADRDAPRSGGRRSGGDDDAAPGRMRLGRNSTGCGERRRSDGECGGETEAGGFIEEGRRVGGRRRRGAAVSASHSLIFVNLIIFANLIIFCGPFLFFSFLFRVIWPELASRPLPKLL